MTSANGLVCFTNCLLPQEDGSLIEKDLWIDERLGVILDGQTTFYLKKQRPDRVIDLGGNILSPGFLDIQINGAYGFDFSVYENDDVAYRQGMQMIAEKIVETGVTSLMPTIITQEKSLYPKLLNLLRPFSTPTSASLLGWHAEGPFIEYTKRGAHAPSFLLPASEDTKSFEDVYGTENLLEQEDWLMSCDSENVGVRVITAAPEIPGVMNALKELTKRGIVFSIGHSVAKTDVATSAVRHGARLITHLFNAMPQFHHRDPSIVGLLGASPHLNSPEPAVVEFTSAHHLDDTPVESETSAGSIEVSTTSRSHLSALFGDGVKSPGNIVPIQTFTPSPTARSNPVNRKGSRPGLHLDKGQVADMAFERPFYGIIVDGIHCHPNSVRLAYTAHPEGCILITDAMKILDPHLQDGVHEWRDGKRFIKEGDKLYLEGTDTLAGSVVTLDKCVRNFSRFTGCSLGEAIKCATYNPAKCLGIENKKGTLRPGAHADLVVLSRQGTVLSTWVRGREIWKV